MDFYGWVVVRSNIINEETYTAIGEISRKSCGIKGTWFGVEDNPNRQMKYNINSNILKKCTNSHLGTLLSNYKSQVSVKVPKSQEYVIWTYNLLKNEGGVIYGQIPNKDYPPCSI